MTREGQRRPTDAEIEAARNQTLQNRRARASEFRAHANALVDDIELKILEAGDAQNVNDREAFLEFVVAMLNNRSLERRLAP
jgi:hypothetical protein